MLGLNQSTLASKAMITRSVLLGLEQSDRKLPDKLALSQVRDAILAEGLVLVDATEIAGEGVRWAKPSGKVWVDCLRYARAMLGYTLDDLAEKSGVGRYVIARLENAERKRINEQSARRLREVLFEKGVIVLEEEVDLGAGVRLRSAIRSDR
ncbi:helix-turn-helix transcriptional regulator [Rhizobium leguminosarum]|uniref:helix-turn-helix domain-containing protein n=1 Tax=Rhizobium leguminosarum TaxID=384 RepID=UPI001C962C5D|nr:helix-turn-helix transcriptional regulator [Rhizobium leguminosarum]MBY5545973.1 helix-turn-helix transcriptional regulator [Rhizobium leguminosarum]